jgi:hypothetical protein
MRWANINFAPKLRSISFYLSMILNYGKYTVIAFNDTNHCQTKPVFPEVVSTIVSPEIIFLFSPLPQ